MEHCLESVLAGRAPSYLTPLLWLHGEEETLLREEVAQMHENGIGSFVVESRPHPDFLGPGWWRDVDILLDEAKKRGMQVWFFDDCAYPSGYSAGRIRDEHPEYLKIYLDERHIDAVGPQKDAAFRVGAWLEADEQLVAAVAARRTDGGDALACETLTELTQRIADGILYWDVPEGSWRLFLLVQTRSGGEPETRDYLNPLEREPVAAFLHYVYEAHYAHYGAEFGKTIAGFFSDEPRFGNAASYEALPGCTGGCTKSSRERLVLPWSKELLRTLSARWGGDFTKMLPCLWYDAGEASVSARYVFMDVVSGLFAENYTQQIGGWCRAHHVRYIGHLIEDNGAHARLGYGAGHFFRAIRGQDWPGLDLIHQVWPGMTDGRFSSQVGYLNADFYMWGIAKMASSASHVSAAQTGGTTICEIFGAYGWQLGLKLMKWLTDHVCVRGVNRLIPHSFSPKPRDPDAPPHFYDRGLNPQWRYFHIWSGYANRVCHLLSGGTYLAPAAVLYHAEAEWAGEAMPFELPVKTLLRAQLDCDVVPADAFRDGRARMDGKTLRIGTGGYRALVIPYAQRLPEFLLEAVLRAADEGLSVFFVDALPSGCPVETPRGAQLRVCLRKHSGVHACACAELTGRLTELGLRVLRTAAPEPSLRMCRYRHEDCDVFFLTNEAPLEPVCTELTVQAEGYPVACDAMENAFCFPRFSREGENVRLRLRVDAYGSCFLLFLRDASAAERLRRAFSAQERPELFAPDEAACMLRLPDTGWTVCAAHAPELDVFLPLPMLDRLGSADRPGLLPRFSGTLRYERSFRLEALPEQRVFLELGRAYETAEVWLNGRRAGARIVPPYRFDVTGLLRTGANTLRIDVTNTLAKERGDGLLDRDMAQEPSGLLGPVRLLYAAGNAADETNPDSVIWQF